MTIVDGDPLLDSVSTLRGVGPTRLEALQSAGIETLRDLLQVFPTRHELFPAPQPIGSLQVSELATIQGEVIRRRVVRSRRKGAGHLQLRLRDDSGEISSTLFNQAYLKSRISRGGICQLTGVVQEKDGILSMATRYVEPKPADTTGKPKEQWRAVHPTIPGVPPATLKAAIAEALGQLTSRHDPLPEVMAKARGLLPLRDALQSVHQPKGREPLAAAEDRLLYNSLISHALSSAHNGWAPPSSLPMPGIAISAQLVQQINESFPFEFTTGQHRAASIIAGELQSEGGLRRLLIGDVGCGKTAVGIWAMAAVLANGHQVAVLAPTGTLAGQWHRELDSFRPGGHEPALLLGGLGKSQRGVLLDALRSGVGRVVVGTHSLLQDDVVFASLGLIIVDEQHRFGVLQRLALTQKGRRPHVLAMSATPIPRTLALCLHGDEDPIEITDRPPGRKAVTTHLYRRTSGTPFDWDDAALRVVGGSRMFVVFPSIQSDDGALPSLLTHGHCLARRFFSDVAVSFLHGAMPREEKDAALEQFRTGKSRVLMTTTVIEVGVDIRDADEIILVGAERFGLAQLHQLRGRVGRGDSEGRCHLIVSNAAPRGESARLRVLQETTSGFEIAAKDLELRGPGDIMGLRQHGAALLPSATIPEDRLQAAVEDARQILREQERSLDVARELGCWSRDGRPRGGDLSGAI